MTTIPPNPEEALVTISTPTSDTVRVRDRVESSRFEFYFDDDVEIKQTSTDEMYFPVDVAATIETRSNLRIPTASSIFVRHSATGEVIAQNEKGQELASFPNDTYEIEIISSPMKIYIGISGELEIRREEGSILLDTSTDASVTIGARSHHEQPAGTIKTDGSIGSVMEAVSTFGSALKTTTAERSWPTLRGYPPQIALGGTHEIPTSINRPDVDIKIQIPPTLESVFKITPLAYYLAAKVEPLPGEYSTPRVVAAEESHELEGDLGVAAVNLLRRNIMLDCITRAEGLYSIPIREREMVARHLTWDPAEVYHESLAERFNRYQEIPAHALQEIHAKWPLTIDVQATRESIPNLSHIAEELALVRTPAEGISTTSPTPAFVNDFVRADGSGVERSSGSTKSKEDFEISQPDPWDTQIHTSLLDEYPLGSNKTTNRAYERHIDRQAPEKEAIKVKVVCNDDQMREEEIVTELYGVRDLLEFDVTIHQNIDVAEFKSLLMGSFDLLHYIGHVDEEGILCADGYLDLRTDIDTVGIDAFILNACRSVPQGEALLDLGAIGGVVTLFDVPNSSATAVGRNLSRLLNRGFPIRTALEIARESSLLGRRWVSIGDGRVSLTQSESGMPIVANVSHLGNDRFDLELEWFETTSHRIGSMMKPNTDWGEYQVLPSSTRREVTSEELDEMFGLEVIPVRSNGELYWTDEVSPAELRKN